MKNGFTLIELLAVIVILAIIATIALPKILSVIDDSESSSFEISAKHYTKAVEQAVIRYNLTSEVAFRPNECIINKDGSVTCDGVTLNIEVKGEKPTSGKITFEEQKIKSAEIDFQGILIMKNISGDFVDKDKLICTAAKPITEDSVADDTAITTGNVPKGNFEIGDEYICEVKNGAYYHFFVLSVQGDKINLILDRNIYSDGTLASYYVTEEAPLNGKWNIVQWVSKKDFIDAGGTAEEYGAKGNNTKGPISAIKFLEKATKTWNKLSNINETYSDESGMYPTMKLQGKARLPKNSEISETGCGVGNKHPGTCPLWLVNYLAKSDSYTQTEKYNVTSVEGYWLLSSQKNVNMDSARAIHYQGFIAISNVINKKRGVRPVISVSKDRFY